MDWFTVIIAVVLSIIIYYFLSVLNADRVTKLINKIPGPFRLPIVGTSYLIAFTPREEIFRDIAWFRKYGNIVRTWLGPLPAVHVMTPENIEVVLNNSVQITKGIGYDTIVPWLGEGLLTSTGSKWFKHRKLITPTFHFKILENFMEVFVDKSKDLVEHLRKKVPSGQVFDMYPYITHCTLNIICETAMGVKINAMEEEDNDYVKCIYGVSQIAMNRIFQPWLLNDRIFSWTKSGKLFKKYVQTLHNFTTQVINDRKKALLSEKKNSKIPANENEMGTKKRKAFLDLFIELSEGAEGFTDHEIREQVDTFMFEGHDTTTAGISWALFLLGNYPKIQEEVYEEIERVFENSTDGNLTIPDLAELKLLERCIKEALRMYPSVPTIARLLTEDINIGGYLVPAGCTAVVEIHLVHRDEKLYPEPEKFDPNRFLPENTKGRHAYAYVPFSAGPRNCIGQKFALYEEKTLLAYILKNYKVKSCETPESVRPMIELVLRPKNGLQVILEARKK